MLGGIYTEEKCPICLAEGKDGRMEDNHRDAVCCPRHKKEKAHNLIIKFGREFKKRTTDYQAACRILTGVRFKYDEGTYDPRDYLASNPLGIDKQIEKYLSVKEATLKPGSLKSLRPHARRIADYFKSENVKNIGYAEIEDFLLAQKGIGGKTKDCLCSVLHDFYVWLKNRQVIRKDQLPDFPKIKYSLGYRKIISKETQIRILDEIKRITPKNPRIYIGALWLSTYINLRPSELLLVLEHHIDYERGLISIVGHKTEKVDSKPKMITLLPDDLESIKRLPRGFPMLPFFRHDVPCYGAKAGDPFGRGLIYDTWKRACKNLGIEGVDLYGGTRHSSSSALREQLSFEDTKQLLGDETNEATLRYIQQDIELMRARYALTRQWTTSGPLNRAGVTDTINKKNK
jgi:hypothetical protein